MNFFFGFKNTLFNSELVVPRYQNCGKTRDYYSLFSAEIDDGKWLIKNISENHDKDFFYINNNIIDSHKIFFISNEYETNLMKKKKFTELLNLNNFTNTNPEFRANFKIKNQKGGYSSYQSDYPYEMTKINGNILSSLFSLTNKDADKNYIIMRNIFYKPIIENFKAFVINVKTKKILDSFMLRTNYSNIIELEKNFVNEDCYLFTKSYIGIPIFLSSKNDHLSLEHTLPLTSYVLSSNKYKLVSDIKRELNEITN